VATELVASQVVLSFIDLVNVKLFYSIKTVILSSAFQDTENCDAENNFVNCFPWM
jgi:hypothetical protein